MAVTPDTIQRVKNQTLSALRSLRDNMQITTERFSKEVSKAVKSCLQETKLVEVPAEVEALRNEITRQRGRGRGLLNALSHGFGVFKSEAEKLFKD